MIYPKSCCDHDDHTVHLPACMPTRTCQTLPDVTKPYQALPDQTCALTRPYQTLPNSSAWLGLLPAKLALSVRSRCSFCYSGCVACLVVSSVARSSVGPVPASASWLLRRALRCACLPEEVIQRSIRHLSLAFYQVWPCLLLISITRANVLFDTPNWNRSVGLTCEPTCSALAINRNNNNYYRTCCSTTTKTKTKQEISGHRSSWGPSDTTYGLAVITSP